MSLLERILGKHGDEDQVADLSALTWASLLPGLSAKSGASVSVTTALGVAAVFACCRVLAEGISQLPLKLYRETGTKKSLALDHPAYHVLSRRPNDWQTSFEWRETAMLHALLCKGAFTYISRGSDGRVLELIPLLPGNVTVIQDAGREVAFRVVDQRGIIATLPRRDVHHLRGPSWDALQGLEVVTMAREAIGLSLSAEETLSRMYANGTRPSGILMADGQLKKEQLERIKAAFAGSYEGTQNAFRTVVLDGGLKYTQTQINPADTQTNEARQHQSREVCRFFRVFPQMIGADDKSPTYASAEQFFIAHVVHSLGPWIERWEQSIERDILTREEVESAGIFVKLHTAGLLRGDSAARGAFYKAGIQDGWLTRNEARALEDLDPIGGLDQPLVPLNMSPAGAQTKGKTEFEEKIGRVLSATNEGKLVEARDLISEVLDQVDAQQ